jgi:hypothetical protein
VLLLRLLLRGEDGAEPVPAVDAAARGTPFTAPASGPLLCELPITKQLRCAARLNKGQTTDGRTDEVSGQ